MIRYSFNPISEIFIQPSHLLKYLWNPITEIFVQSKNGNLCSIHSWTYLFNPFENTFNPSDISFNPSWGERRQPKLTRGAEASSHNYGYGGSWYFSFESDLPKVFEVFSSKSRNPFNGGFFALRVWGGLYLAGRRRGLYMEGLIFGILRYLL